MSGWPENLYDGARHEYVPTFRTRMDALKYLALHFGRTIHVFEAGWTCLVCGVAFDSLDQAQAVACRVDGASRETRSGLTQRQRASG